MSELVGEVYVAVRPDTAGFGPALTEGVATGAAAAGRAASEGFSAGFKPTAGLQTVERELGSVERGAAAAAFSFRGFGRAVAYAGGTFLAVGSAVSLLKTSVQAAADLEGQQTLLARSIANAGAANTLYGESVDELVRKQALQTGFTQTELLPAFARLVQATGSTAKAYADLGLAEDLARQRGTTVAQAALAVGKAADGSATSLQRYGIVIPATTVKLTAAQKAAEALALAEEKVGGSAAAFAETGAGQLDRLHVAINTIEEAVGQALLPEVEQIATRTADWAANSANLARVQSDVSQTAHAVEDGIHGVATALDLVKTAVSPVVDLLGGYGQAAELVFGAVALAKVKAITVGLIAWGRSAVAAAAEVVTGEEAASAATTAYTAAVSANTVALEANVAAQRLTVGAFNTLGLGAQTVERDVGAATVATNGAQAGFLSLEASGAGLAAVMRSSLAPAVVLASYELSKFIREIPGWNSAMESFGGTLESVAEKLGLISARGVSATSAAAAATLNQASTQQRLVAAYQTAIQEIPGSGQFVTKARDALIAKLVGPGYTFHDAQVLATEAARIGARTAAGAPSAVTRSGASQAAAAAAAAVGRPTDLDYKLQVAQVQAAGNTKAELALYQQRADYLTKRIDRLKADGDLTAEQKKQELDLYTQRAAVEQQINEIEQKRVAAAKQAAQNARTLYTSEVTAHEQELQLDLQRAQLAGTFTAAVKHDEEQLVVFYRQEAVDAKLTATQRAQFASQLVQTEATILSQEKQAYQDRLALEEQRLQLAAKRAELTQSVVTDDRQAALALIRFYTREAHDVQLTEAERLQYAAQAIDERITLRQLTGQAQGATAAQIFAEAAAEERTYGSNIATRTGVLSGQDERARLAQILLSEGSVGRQADQARHQQQLSEQRRQTQLLTQSRDLLARIAGGGPLRSTGTAPRPAAPGINRIRDTHQMVGVN